MLIFLFFSHLFFLYYIYIYTHHLSCWQWNDDDNKSHVTFAYRVPQLSCFYPVMRLCKMPVYDIRLVAICSPTLIHCMQTNVHNNENEKKWEKKKDSPIPSVYVFIPNKYLTFSSSFLFSWCSLLMNYHWDHLES